MPAERPQQNQPLSHVFDLAGTSGPPTSTFNPCEISRLPQGAAPGGQSSAPMRIGIDGSNSRQGGGITYLVQLLSAAEPAVSGIGQVSVWGASHLLEQLPLRSWLTRVRVPELEQGGIARLWWQQTRLAAAARVSADMLFSPGGTYLGTFRPFVTMFRNMLPFDPVERRGYGHSPMRAKLELLRHVQAATFRRADGVIFLTEHGRTTIDEVVKVPGSQTIIPHGLHPRFFRPVHRQNGLTEFSFTKPFRWLYVSAIHQYKHPWNVIEAAAALRAEGIPVTIDLVGPPHPGAMDRLKTTIARIDRRGEFVTVTPDIGHQDLPRAYRDADGFVFASTCENMPNSLLEAMAAGLPICCSERAPMPQILGAGGVYCNPESPSSLAAGMKQLMIDPDLRLRTANAAQARARAYDWSRCATDTFTFISETYRRRRHPEGDLKPRTAESLR